MVIIPADEMRSTCIAALMRRGVPANNAHLQADLLLEAELRGRPSHGVMRLPRILKRIDNGVTIPLASGKHKWRSTGFLQVDGQAGLGPVVAMASLDAAATRVKSTGAVVVGIRNNNHLGMLAWYAEKFAARGLVLIALSTSEALVHPWRGRSAMIGTNPLAIGVPTEGNPFVLDMATSIVSMGQIHDYAQRNEPLPAGWAIDADGKPTTDAVAAKSGAIAPFGGAKGYALGLALEVLVVALTASALGTNVRGSLDDDQDCTKGDVFVLIDPAMQPSTALALYVYLEQVRDSGETAGAVMIPGDRAAKERDRRLKEGLSIPQPLWQQLSSFGVDQV